MGEFINAAATVEGKTFSLPAIMFDSATQTLLHYLEQVFHNLQGCFCHIRSNFREIGPF